jgi:uncharacterized protein
MTDVAARGRTSEQVTRQDSEYWTLAGTVVGPQPKQELEALVEREQATVADPMPLGLAGFASATFTISVALAGWFGPGFVVMAIPVALVFGGIGQFLAGMWAFRRGNVLAATAFSAFGAFNAAWAILEWLILNHTLPGIAGGGNPAYVTGIFVLTFSLIALYLGIAAMRVNRVVVAILLILAIAYLFDGIGIMIGGFNPVLAIGGYAGLLTSLIAFYLSAAIVINSASEREMLPVLSAPHAGPSR